MATPPELQQLLALSRDRTAYQNPLFQAVTQMAYQNLPTYARAGTQLSGTLSNQAPAPTPEPGGSGLRTALGAAGAGALLANALSGAGGDLGSLIKGLKKLLHIGDNGRDTVQGDQPFPGGALTGPPVFDPTQFMGWPDFGGSPEQIRQPKPSVETSETFALPSYLASTDPFGPYLPTNPFPDFGPFGFPSDPSGGSGIGPGMRDYYSGGGGSGSMTDFWNPEGRP